MSDNGHSKSAPNYMIKQSLWNMGKQIQDLQGMIGPDTRLMQWQNHLTSMAQRDMQHVHNSIAYSKHVHGGQGYGAYALSPLPPRLPRPRLDCPRYYLYKRKEQAAARKYRMAKRRGHRKAAVAFAAAADKWRAAAAAARAACDRESAFGEVGDFTCGAGGDYSGCGTFFGKTKNDSKRACWLEKKISKHQECCDRDCSWWSGKGNQANQCAKIARWEAELMQITGGEGGMTDLSQQADAQLAAAYTQANMMGQMSAMEGAKTGQMLGMAALAGGGILLVLALR